MAGTDNPVNSVLVQLYPRSNVKVEMSRSAALHLLHLGRRYNFTLSDPQIQSKRWGSFWPAIAQIERTMVVMFVDSNTNGQFGRKVNLLPLESELMKSGNVGKLSKFTKDVQDEFFRLRHIFIKSLISISEIEFLWSQKSISVMSNYRVAATESLKAWWSGDGCSELRPVLQANLCKAGASDSDASQLAFELVNHVEQAISTAEDALGCART